MDTIDSKSIGTVDGFDISARIVPDLDGAVDNSVYTAAQRKAYVEGSWSFVGTVISASRASVVLGSASLWGSEYGLLPGIKGWVSPLDGDGESFVNGYGPQLITEAVAEAVATLDKINNV